MRRIVLVSIAFVLVVGCGPSNPDKSALKGTITYNGKGVNAAGLLLYPTTGKGGGTFMIPVTQDGAFNSADVPAGDYRIIVQAVPPADPNMSPGTAKPTIPFPAKYKDIQSTDLTCTIKPGDRTPLNLELKDN